MDKTAFLFPGQGSQKRGMLSGLVQDFPLIMQTFEDASDILGFDLWDIVLNNPDELLNQTQYTQPAIFTSSIALWRCAELHCDLRPDFVAGHSLGEYSALVCSGVLSFVDGLVLVRKRGQYMQEAVPSNVGAMAAVIGLDDDTVTKVCDALSQEATTDASETLTASISVANLNCPGQVVVAGDRKLVEKSKEFFIKEGARSFIILPVSVPSHCPMMKQAALKLAEDFKTISFSEPTIPVVHNVTASVCSDEKIIREYLISQLVSPVRWTESVRFMLKSGVTAFYECGPGKVLSGLGKRIEPSIPIFPMETGKFFS